MLISPAFAQAAGGAGAMDINFLLTMGLVFIVFYFLLIRPQQKKAKEHRTMLAGIKRGDRIVTGGGIIGTVTKAIDEELTVEVAESVRLRVTRGSVMGLYQDRGLASAESKTEVKADAAEGEAAKPEASAGGSKLRRLLGGK